MAILKINSDLAGHLNKENIHSDDAKDDLSDTASDIKDTMDNESGFYDDEASEKSLNDDYMDEEPVSPPPCPPDEAPQLLMSQTIEVSFVIIIYSVTFRFLDHTCSIHE